MRRFKRLFGVLVLVLAAMLSGVAVAHAKQQCHGASCVGLKPQDTSCVDDAKSIRAFNVNGNGMLELRWSKACNTGWARFTTYRRAEEYGKYSGTGIVHVDIRAWTDQGSQNTAGVVMKTLQGTSYWSKMVDFGRPKVCYGARLIAADATNQDKTKQTSGSSGQIDLGWFQGTCVQ